MRKGRILPAVAAAVAVLATALIASDVCAGETQKPAASASATPRKLTPEEQAVLRQLLVHAEAEPDMGPPPLKVKFSPDFYYDDVVEKPKLTWTFGDGSPQSHERNPTHTYKKEGKYKVTLYATDAQGRAGSDDTTIDVSNLWK